MLDVKRLLPLLALVLLLLGLPLGGWLYTTHQQVQATGKSVFRALKDDGMPLSRGVLDDPVFRTLPPPRQPPSLGRYLPPKAASPAGPVQSGGAPLPATPAPAPPPDPATAASPQAPERVAPRPGPFLDPSPDRPLGQQKIHILLIGNDQPDLGRGRADTLLALTFDPTAQTLYLTSVPRDTRIDLPGHGQVKINAAYAYGGATLQTAAVERFLGIPFDKYVEVSLNGFQRAIDEVGGVQITSALRFDLDGQHIEPGRAQLGGAQALAYARMRKGDPRGDLGRTVRQQEVIRALMKALGNLSTSELTRLLGRLQTELQTDFSPSEVVRLRAAHPYMLSRQTAVPVQGVNRKLGGIWYYLVPDQERQRLHLLLR
jgi:polyisoprenyl-teichoic acid--peptidoglycan teichoic acid transferase